MWSNDTLYALIEKIIRKYSMPSRKIKPLYSKENIEDLDNNVFFKLICGASTTDAVVIRDLSYLYSLGGANMIDVSSDEASIKAAKEGISLAKKKYEESPDKYSYYKEPILMVSINASDDPHFKTANIDDNICQNCGLCVYECSFVAISRCTETRKSIINKKLCYGCGKCVSICPSRAINLCNNEVDLDYVLTKLIDDSVAAIEIHTGSSSFENLQSFWNRVTSLLGEDRIKRMLISFSLESALYSTKEFVEYAKNITTLTPRKPILQVDGMPMSGGIDASSTLQSLAFGQVLLKNNIDAYIVLAGGVNNKTKELLDLFNLSCNGIAMGTFSRKLLWPYLGKLDNKVILKKAIRITTKLVQGLEF